MAQAGEILENPVAGIRLVWRRTSADTRGQTVVAEVVLEPTGFVPSLHIHPRQQQRIEVLQGALGMQIGSARSVVGPGARLTVPPGVPHRFWNADAVAAQAVVELTPALNIEALVEILFSLAAAGKVDERGRPHPLQRSVLAAAYFDTLRPAFPPALLQRLSLAAAAPLGRALGYRSTAHPSS